MIMGDATKKVCIRRCDSYHPGTIRDRLREILRSLGEPGNLIGPGKKVLLKPNVLGQWGPEHAITTHPEIVKQLTIILREAGCEVSVGDSSGGKAEAHRTQAALEASGLWSAAEEAGATIANFDATGAVPVTVRDRTYHLASAVQQADVVISVPKLKTHSLTVLTCAVKNLYGCVPGLGKVRLHRQYPGVQEFSEVVVDICEGVAPQYTVVDAVVGMDGNGPAHGRIRDVGLLIGGDCPFCVDRVISELTGIGPERVPTVKIAAERGVGPDSCDQIAIDGPDQGELNIEPFVLPITADMSPGGMRRFLSFILRHMKTAPVVDAKKCTGCSFCGSSCPVDAITMHNKLPKIDRTTCIECLCCCEVCPQLAFEVKPVSTMSAVLEKIANVVRRRALRQ